MKACKRCLIDKPLEHFSRAKAAADGCSPWCKLCHREYGRAWKRPQPQRRDPDSARAAQRRYRERHAAKRSAQHAAWAKENAASRAAATAKRKAARLQATPPWADMDAIKAIYVEARRIQVETGQRMHVDHVIPLQHELVCGLHCEANLQILPGPVNEGKGNRFDAGAWLRGDQYV